MYFYWLKHYTHGNFFNDGHASMLASRAIEL
jgi:hypothetical protein